MNVIRHVRASKKHLTCLAVTFLLVQPVAGSDEYWTQSMRDLHASFTGRSGTIARIGDSIFRSLAYLLQVQVDHQNLSSDAYQGVDWIRDHVTDDAWTWQSPQTGAEGETSHR